MRQGKILILILMALFCLSFKTINISAEELPPCNTNFYGIYGKIDGVETDGTILVEATKKNWIGKGGLLGESYVINWTPNKVEVGAWFAINSKNLIKDLTFSIETETEGVVCESIITPPKGIEKGDDVQIYFMLKENVSVNGDNTCEKGAWTYGSIEKINFSGHYYNYSSGDGKIEKLSTYTSTIRRCGRHSAKETDEYDRPTTTPSPTNKDGSYKETTATNNTNQNNPGIAKATSSKEMTKVVGNNDMACNTIGELFDDYWPYVMVIVPILLIVMMAIDFFKAMSSNDAEALTKASSNALKRTIATIIILALPVLLKIIFDIMGLDFCL